MLDSHPPLFEKAAESNLQDSIKPKEVSSIEKLALPNAEFGMRIAEY